MGRPKRAADGGLIYHVLNRANARSTIFASEADYEAFERVLLAAVERTGTRLLAYCLMPNHWHLVVWPHDDGELSRFVGWLTLTHTQRWHAAHGTTGCGHLYQGRFKSFPVEDDEHFLTVARYVERNALRAKLVRDAADWRWSSLARWLAGGPARGLLTPWPVRRSPDWLAHVNSPQTEAEVAALQRSIQRGVPFGGAEWTEWTIARLGLESTLRPRGRPKASGKGS